MRLPRLSEWHVVGSVRGKRGRRVVVMEIGGLSAQAVGSMRVAVWFNGMRVSSRKVAASHAVEVLRTDSVSRWVGRPPFCCWWAEVRSRERGQGQIVRSGFGSCLGSGEWTPVPLGCGRCFSKTPRWTPRLQLQAVSPPEEVSSSA